MQERISTHTIAWPSGESGGRQGERGNLRHPTPITACGHKNNIQPAAEICAGQRAFLAAKAVIRPQKPHTIQRRLPRIPMQRSEGPLPPPLSARTRTTHRSLCRRGRFSLHLRVLLQSMCRTTQRSTTRADWWKRKFILRRISQSEIGPAKLSNVERTILNLGRPRMTQWMMAIA